MKPELDQRIRGLHEIYVKLVSPLQLTMERMMRWEQWLGYIEKALAETASEATPEQVLRVVIGWRRKQHREARHILVSMLAFDFLVGKPERAEQDFAAWRVEKRERANLPDRGLAAIERATGRAADTAQRTAGGPAQSAGQVVDKSKMLAAIAAMKEAVK